MFSDSVHIVQDRSFKATIMRIMMVNQTEKDNGRVEKQME